jgi:hypothetical protein
MGARLLAGICLLSLMGTASEPACPPRAKETAPIAAKTTATVASPVAPAPTPAPTRADPFVTTVRPVLVAHCTPCHETGGKMYDKLPFDNPKVVADHRAGVLRRLKGDDRAVLEAWLKTQSVD